VKTADERVVTARQRGREPVPQPPASAAWRTRRAVLLVDDRGWDREALSAGLRGHGLRPMTLPGPERALALLSRTDEPLEAVVFPASLRGGALPFARRLAEVRPELARVAVSDAPRAAELAPLRSLAPVVSPAEAADALRDLCARRGAAPCRAAKGTGS
jgi:hypothetical protein